MPLTVEQIEADIAAIRASPNWATNPIAMGLYTELLKEKNLLTQSSQAPPAGKD